MNVRMFGTFVLVLVFCGVCVGGAGGGIVFYRYLSLAKGVLEHPNHTPWLCQWKQL